MGLRDFFKKTVSNSENSANNTNSGNNFHNEEKTMIGGENCIEKSYGEVESDNYMRFYVPFDKEVTGSSSVKVMYPERYCTSTYQVCVNRAPDKSKCDGCKAYFHYIEEHKNGERHWSWSLPFSVFDPGIAGCPPIHNSRRQDDHYLIISSGAYDKKTNKSVMFIGAMPAADDGVVNHYRPNEYKGRYIAEYFIDKKEYELYETRKILDIVPMKPFLLGEGLLCYLGVKDEFVLTRDTNEKVLLGTVYIDTEDDEYRVMKPALDALKNAGIKAGDVIDKAEMMNISLNMFAADIDAFDDGIKLMEENMMLFRVSEDRVMLTSFGHSVIYDEFIGLEEFNP